MGFHNTNIELLHVTAPSKVIIEEIPEEIAKFIDKLGPLLGEKLPLHTQYYCEIILNDSTADIKGYTHTLTPE